MSWMRSRKIAATGRYSAAAVALRNVRVFPVVTVLLLSGCAATRPANTIATSTTAKSPLHDERTRDASISLVSHQNPEDKAADVDVSATNDSAAAAQLIEPARPIPPATIESLAELESVAVTQNPALRRLEQEYHAARARVAYIDGLPDPTIGASVFAAPIETAAGSQRANLMIAQMLPWLPRLDAQAQQACFEAMALQQVYAAERLKVIGDVRAMWYRLYVIQKQIETQEASQEFLESLIEVASARVSIGKATQGDVLMGTLEYSKLEEQLLTLHQQHVSTVAEIDRLLGRQFEVAMVAPNDLDIAFPDWSHPVLRQLAWEHQPDIAAARIRTQATRWGVEVANLKRRPDFSVSASWFAIDGNRPTSNIVDVGQDAWSLGASVSIPLWERKYDAMAQEARWKHAASHASVDESMQRYDAILRDLWEQAKAADETARLYKTTILPQAQDTLDADRQSYSNGNVGYDRVIGDFRNLLTLELGYHRAVGQLATALTRIRQAAGTDPGEFEAVDALN